MRTGLVVDYGGVLTTPVTESFASFCDAEGIEFDAFKRALVDAARTAGSPFARVETGAITQQVFDEEVAALLFHACGARVDPTGLKQRMFAAVKPDEAMVDAVKAARARGIRTALLSNSWGGADYPREIFDETFDAVVISGEVGMRKPDAEIYLFTAKSVGLAPEQCVFVDDARVNVDGAIAVGMAGVLHRDAAGTLPELERLLGAGGAPDEIGAGR